MIDRVLRAVGILAINPKLELWKDSNNCNARFVGNSRRFITTRTRVSVQVVSELLRLELIRELKQSGSTRRFILNK